MTAILEVHLEDSLVSNQGKWLHQMAQIVFIGDKSHKAREQHAEKERLLEVKKL